MIWRTPNGSRYFVIPDDHQTPAQGDVTIVDLYARTRAVSEEWLAPFECTETQARRLAKHELGQALTEIRASIDGTLAKYRARLDAVERTPVGDHTAITPGAVAPLIDLLKELPGAIGGSLSRDEIKVTQARDTLTTLEARLKASGIDLDGRLAGFADRLHALRTKPDDEP